MQCRRLSSAGLIESGKNRPRNAAPNHNGTQRTWPRGASPLCACSANAGGESRVGPADLLQLTQRSLTSSHCRRQRGSSARTTLDRRASPPLAAASAARLCLRPKTPRQQNNHAAEQSQGRRLGHRLRVLILADDIGAPGADDMVPLERPGHIARSRRPHVV